MTASRLSNRSMAVVAGSVEILVARARERSLTQFCSNSLSLSSEPRGRVLARFEMMEANHE
jgi:hypothetical protein